MKKDKSKLSERKNKVSNKKNTKKSLHSNIAATISEALASLGYASDKVTKEIKKATKLIAKKINIVGVEVSNKGKNKKSSNVKKQVQAANAYALRNLELNSKQNELLLPKGTVPSKTITSPVASSLKDLPISEPAKLSEESADLPIVVEQNAEATEEEAKQESPAKSRKKPVIEHEKQINKPSEELNVDNKPANERANDN